MKSETGKLNFSQYGYEVSMEYGFVRDVPNWYLQVNKA